MDLANSWVMDVLGPAVLLIVLVSLVIGTRSSRDGREGRLERGARDLHAHEEQRRRNRTDQL